METKISDILAEKGHEVITIEPSASVYQSIKKMVDNDVGTVIVKDDTEIYGIFSERDYVRRVAIKNEADDETDVGELVTSEVIGVDPGYTVKESLAIMTKKRFRHLPVLSDGELVGIVSIGDCVKEITKTAEAKVRYMEDYIRGRYPG